MIIGWWQNNQVVGISCMHKFQTKLELLKQHLKHWNKHTFGNIFTRKVLLEQEMEQLQQQIITNGRIDDSTLQEQQVLTQPVERTKQERSYWEQKSCINLLREGEHNTSFSHISTIQHRRCNCIIDLKTNEVRLLEIHKNMETEFADYFEDMLTKNEQERATSIQEVTSHIPSLVTEQQNATLMRPTML